MSFGVHFVEIYEDDDEENEVENNQLSKSMQ
jgi:hypothetical protein